MKQNIDVHIDIFLTVWLSGPSIILFITCMLVVCQCQSYLIKQETLLTLLSTYGFKEQIRSQFNIQNCDMIQKHCDI